MLALSIACVRQNIVSKPYLSISVKIFLTIFFPVRIFLYSLIDSNASTILWFYIHIILNLIDSASDPTGLPSEILLWGLYKTFILYLRFSLSSLITSISTIHGRYFVDPSVIFCGPFRSKAVLNLSSCPTKIFANSSVAIILARYFLPLVLSVVTFK